MSDIDRDKYLQLMREIKRRTEVVNHFIQNPAFALYQQTAVESTCLQIRMILELVALGSLVANQDYWSKSLRAMRNAWNAGDIVKELRKINPDFYPHPLIELPGQGIVQSKLEDRTGDVLSEDEFGDVYGRLGNILHASNPLGKPSETDYYMNNAPIWMLRTMNLLSCHTIRVLDNPTMFLVHMKEERDDDVHLYDFVPMNDEAQKTLVTSLSDKMLN